MKKVCESALFHQKNESYPQRGGENAQKDAVASKVYLTFDATAPFFGLVCRILILSKNSTEIFSPLSFEKGRFRR